MSKIPRYRPLIALILPMFCSLAIAGSIDQQPLQDDLSRIVAGFNGRVGIGVRSDAGVVLINGEQRFSLQSVMKLIVRDRCDGRRGQRRLAAR